MSNFKEGDRAVRKDVGDAGHVYRIHGVQELTGAVLCDFWSDTLGLQNGVNMGVLEAEADESEVEAEVEVEAVAATEVEVEAEVEPEADEDEPAPTRTIAHKGGGYYDLLEDDKDVGTIRGKALAEAWLQE